MMLPKMTMTKTRGDVRPVFREKVLTAAVVAVLVAVVHPHLVVLTFLLGTYLRWKEKQQGEFSSG